MDQKDSFNNWLRTNLEEETKKISFSPEAKERVRNIITHNDFSPKTVAVDQNLKRKYSVVPISKSNCWNDKVSISLQAVSFCVVILFIVAAFYSRTFFYVSSEQIARFETREKVILNDNSTPFGAMQHLVAALENGKGVGQQ